MALIVPTSQYMGSLCSGEQLLGVIEEYLVYSEKIRGHTAMTRKNKQNQLLRFFRWLQGREFNAQNTEEYLNYLLTSGISPNTIIDYLKVLKAFAGWLDRKKDIPYFLKKLEAPRAVEVTKNIPNYEMALKIIEAASAPCYADNKRGRAAKEELRTCFLFMLHTGCRLGGTLNLKVEDVNFSDRKYLLRLKGGKYVKKGMPLAVVPVLQEAIGRRKQGKIWCLRMETLRRSLVRGCKKLEFPAITPHDLRRSFATTLAKQNMSNVKLAQQMNHRKIETTYKYYIDADVDTQTEDLDTIHPGNAKLADGHALLNAFLKSQAYQMLQNSGKFNLVTQHGKVTIELI